jgi:hypothetical protein
VGASNALAAFRLYAGKIPPTALNVLTYMALVALDRDDEPRFWLGHEALAVHCLGRDEASIDDSDLRAVRRAITLLFEVRAITVAQHSSGRGEKGGRATYRLWLVAPAPDEKRPADSPALVDRAPDGNCPVDTASTGRKVVEHRTKSGRAPDAFRPAKEYEETEELVKTQEYPLLSSDSVPSPARETRNASDGVRPVRMMPLWPTAVPPAGTPVALTAAVGESVAAVAPTGVLRYQLPPTSTETSTGSLHDDGEGFDLAGLEVAHAREVKIPMDAPGDFEAVKQRKMREFEAWMHDHPESA